MAVTYGFFDAVYDSSTGTYDRTYTAEQMSMYFKGLVSDGVIANVGDMMAVTPGDGMTVQVGSGRMIVDSRWLNNDSAYTVTLSPAHATLPRKDIVFVQLDYSMRRISIEHKSGTPATSPVAPTIGDYPAAWHDMGLAIIDVPAGATQITAANITDLRPDESTCGFVTGLVDQIDTDGMWSQLQADFEEWFNIMKDQLTTDAAGSLQTQIDDLDSRLSTTSRTLVLEQTRIASILSTLKDVTGDQTQTVPSGTDFNDLITPGCYQIGNLGSMTNKPYSGGYGILEVVRARSYIIQRFTFIGGNYFRIYMRASVDKGQTWRAWVSEMFNG